MYLAGLRDKGHLRYELRQSYYDQSRNRYLYRLVFDLGDDPAVFIHYVTDRIHYFDESLESAVAQVYEGDPTVVLEELLWNFLSAEARRLVREFGRKSEGRLSPLSSAEQEEVQRYIHIFDRRRLFFIRYGAVDQSRVYRLNEKIYRPLLFKCRDEKEYYFKQMELSLPSRDLKKYIFVIFNLQQEFSENYSVFMPEALDSERMEEAFVAELCRLNEDSSFWQEDGDRRFLHPHLEDYLIRFFDYDFERPSFARDFYESFRASHRSFRWPQREKTLSEEETTAVFGRGIDDLKKMNKMELAKLFRAKAKKHHPDRGGEAEKFIQLLRTYEILKKSLKS
ncbi:hypothetical protein [Desulfopila inferna]|uniref:hypothetical protein n=1 Tax=Desulfopila inferna TaxID=468528 RepID=UPI001964C481|nr:hypothetical protein [Desulfopila inferna]MBM9604901.1 hypothetical protein [Desulfopila inferna]